mmetsp:Transcript_45177/g.125348  ORF Transcript_45177/g.125348 Transcript_45177/m.125348 type:complete len:290 (+) Transcript_45177:1721-2590(+)
MRRLCWSPDTSNSNVSSFMEELAKSWARNSCPSSSRMKYGSTAFGTRPLTDSMATRQVPMLTARTSSAGRHCNRGCLSLFFDATCFCDAASFSDGTSFCEEPSPDVHLFRNFETALPSLSAGDNSSFIFFETGAAEIAISKMVTLTTPFCLPPRYRDSSTLSPVASEVCASPTSESGCRVPTRKTRTIRCSPLAGAGTSKVSLTSTRASPRTRNTLVRFFTPLTRTSMTTSPSLADAASTSSPSLLGDRDGDRAGEGGESPPLKKDLETTLLSEADVSAILPRADAAAL